jgi:NAD+ diphosphatase
MRSIATQALLPRPIVGVLAQAKSLMSWHARHQFCANCGQPTHLAAAGWRRECTACGAAHFPRTDPVVIMLASAGERCLLGRQARFPKGMYSALAGFLEPGETVEDAVRREIREEAGIEIGGVSYVASQPWPFPASLMIGCFALAKTRDVVLDGAELEDARWFDRDELRAMFAGTHPGGLTAPNPIAIAHHLLKAWLETD